MRDAPEPAELMEVATRAVEAGAEVALGRFGDPRLNPEEKAAPDDLVSEADRDAERAIRSVIAAARPDDEILGEELGVVDGSSSVRWLVDPIDGTTSYLYGRGDWAVSAAAASKRDELILAGAVAEPVHDTVTSACLGGGAWSSGDRLRCSMQADLSNALVELNFGVPLQRKLAGSVVAALLPEIRDLRRSGSAAAALAKVASGRADAYWGPGLAPWDAAAGLLLAREAGAETGDLAGPRAGLPSSGDVLAANAALWPQLRALISTVWVTPSSPSGESSG